MKRLFALAILLQLIHVAFAQPHTAAAAFIATLSPGQKQKALFPFESDERYNFHFFPKDDRKGISWNALTPPQRRAAMVLVRSCMSQQGADKAFAIMQLEGVLKALENRGPDDHYRDSGNYYFSLFGEPASHGIWSWRLEGHHLSFTFSTEKNELVSATPAFMGANPAIVRDGPKKGTQVLKEEAVEAFALLHQLSAEQLAKTRIDTTAPNEIVTFVSRKAMIEHPEGILYGDLNKAQQQQLQKLIGVYVHRYNKSFADAFFKEVADAGMDSIRFAWAGATDSELGKAHYYRVQGPTFIIEYDNSQNNANHVHSVLRDLKHDFGGDLLLEHYKTGHLH